MLANRLGQALELGAIEDAARLLRIGIDAVAGDLPTRPRVAALALAPALAQGRRGKLTRL